MISDEVDEGCSKTEETSDTGSSGRAELEVTSGSGDDVG
jgi:hypothetical protein